MVSTNPIKQFNIAQMLGALPLLMQRSLLPQRGGLNGSGGSMDRVAVRGTDRSTGREADLSRGMASPRLIETHLVLQGGYPLSAEPNRKPHRSRSHDHRGSAASLARQA